MATESKTMNVDVVAPVEEQDVQIDPEVQMRRDLEQFVVKVALTAETKEMRHLNRVIRHTFASYRRKWNPTVLAHLILKYFPDTQQEKNMILSLLPHDAVQAARDNQKEEAEKATSKMEITPSAPVTTVIDTTKSKSDKEVKSSKDSNDIKEEKALVTTISDFFPEVEVFLTLLPLIWLMDTKQLMSAKDLADHLEKRLEVWNRRTLDSLSAKVYFYFSRVYELLNQLSEIRPKLFALYRTSVLRHNIEGQTALLNLLLRNFLSFNLYEQANKLISNVDFKESSVSSNEVARYYYYQGRILALDPEKYATAFEYLQQALRKAPSQGAKGFRVAVLKLTVIVQLLMGDIPERSLFIQKGISVPLAPYLQLTTAVRFGDLAAFQACILQHHNTFTKDKTLSLIQRMRNNVIKTGLRKINLAYSKISLQDIAQKLKLDSVEDAEFIVAKAIKEKIIDANIVHSQGFVASNEIVDVYTTKEPQEQLHLRTDFFLKIHNDAMKAMRYRPDAGKRKEDSEEMKQKLKEEEELAAALADEDDYDDFY